MIGSIKHIIVIESLRKEDGVNFTGEALYNDVIKRRINLFEKDLKHNIHKVNDKESFKEIINYYNVNSSYLSGGILFHLEIHGDDEKNGVILSSGELLKWEELSDLLRPINISTSNKVFLTMGICYGRFFYKGIDPYKKTPYSGFISASMSVSPEEIYVNFSLLFEKLIENGNIVESYLEMEKTKTNFYYTDAERLFDEAFKSTLQQMHDDSDLRDKILKNAIDETKKRTGTELSKKESNIIFERAINDIYKAQKNAFQF